MKSLTTTLSVLLLFGIALSLSLVFSSKTSEFNEILNTKFVSDRVYYKFDSIASGLLKIIRGIYGLNVGIQEKDFNTVTFQETPKDTAGYANYLIQLSSFKSFVEETAREETLNSSLNITAISERLPFNILPYGISYVHPSPFLPLPLPEGGIEFLNILHSTSPPAYLKNYNIVIRVGWEIKDITTICSGECDCIPPLEARNFTWNITTIASDGIYGSNITALNYDDTCAFIIRRTPSKWLNFTQDENRQGSLIYRLRLQPGDPIPESTVSLNLTDIQGKLKVSLPSNIISVKELLYQIERNDTTYFY